VFQMRRAVVEWAARGGGRVPAVEAAMNAMELGGGGFQRGRGGAAHRCSTAHSCALKGRGGSAGEKGTKEAGEKNGGAAAMAMGGGGRRWKVALTGGPHLSASA
jgi:hypothetical protein